VNPGLAAQNHPTYASFCNYLKKTRGNRKTLRNDKFDAGRVVPPEGQVHPTSWNNGIIVGFTRALRPGTTQPAPILQLPLKKQNIAAARIPFRPVRPFFLAGGLPSSRGKPG
jgi:hypothetical protein